MITAYRSDCKSVSPSDFSDWSALPDDVVWIDLVEPTSEEEASLEQLLGVDIPTREAGDRGQPVTAADPANPVAQSFLDYAAKLAKTVTG